MIFGFFVVRYQMTDFSSNDIDKRVLFDPRPDLGYLQALGYTMGKNMKLGWK